MTYLEGIDISWAQRKTPKLAGLAFVVVKASEGNGKDPRWDQHSAAVRDAGLPLMAYHFGRAEWPVSVQLDVFHSVAGSADAWALDYEPSPSAKTLMSEGAARQFIASWQQHDEIGLYGAEHFPWPTFPSDSFGAEWRWVANQAREPRVPFDMWQWAGRTIDRDRATQAALDKILRKSAPVHPPEGNDVKFIQLNSADAEALPSMPIPVGTLIADFTGDQWDTITDATHLHYQPGLPDAHTGRPLVVVSTGRFYADRIKRPTVQIAVLPKGTNS